MVSSSRTWYTAVQWLSPTCVVARQEREAVGNDDERYEWRRIYVGEFERGVLAGICEFDVEFEESGVRRCRRAHASCDQWAGGEQSSKRDGIGADR